MAKTKKEMKAQKKMKMQKEIKMQKKMEAAILEMARVIPKNTKKWYVSRTLWASAIVMAATIAIAILQSPSEMTAVGVISAVATAFLRVITTKPIA